MSIQVEQQPLEIAGYLDVHAGRQSMQYVPHAVGTAGQATPEEVEKAIANHDIDPEAVDPRIA